MKRLLLFVFIAFTCNGLLAQDPTMLQGFYWNTYPGGTWYDSLALRAPQMARAGISSIWLPPPSKGNAGSSDVGYTPYDYFDLGEFDSRGGDQTSGFGAYIPTRYGTYVQLKNAVDQLKANGIQVYMDIVLNHRSGGSKEINPYINYYPAGWDGSLYSQMDSSLVPPQRVTFTAFPLANGSGRFSSQPGTGAQYMFPNGSINPDNTFDFFGSQWGYFEFYKNTFAYDNALHDWDGNPLPAGDSLIVWGEWLTTKLGLDGYRFDFVKGIHWNYLKRWLDTGAMKGKFSVGELYDGDAGRLKDWLDKMSGTQAAASVFDFNMRFGYKEWSDAGPSYDVRNLNGRGLVNQGVSGTRVVTFVDNHDFDRLDYEGNPTGDGHSPIIGSKGLIYAHMLTHPGYACVWWRDYYWYGLRDEINKLLAIRKTYVSGSHEVLTARGDVFWPGNAAEDPKHVYVMRRYGSGGKTGVIFAMNNSDQFDSDVWVTAFDWGNKKLYDLTGNSPDTLQVFGDARVLIKTKKNSYHVWVPTDFEKPFVTDAAVASLSGLKSSYFVGDSATVSALIENQGTFAVNSLTVTIRVLVNGAPIIEQSLPIQKIPGQEFAKIQFPAIKNLAEGSYVVEIYTVLPGDSDDSDNQLSANFVVEKRPTIASFQVDGDFSEPYYQLLSIKQNDNSGFGPGKDIRALYLGWTDDSLYIGIEGELDPSNPNGDGMGLMLNSTSWIGAPAGTPLGNVKGAGHFLQVGDSTLNTQSETYKMAMETDLAFSILAVSQKAVVTIARYSGAEGKTGAVIVPAAEGAPLDGSRAVAGPVNHLTFPDGSIRYAFNNSAGKKKGVEIAIDADLLGGIEAEIQAFAFIISSNAYFSNVTVPGFANGSADGFNNLGFSPDFGGLGGAPYFTCPFDLVTESFSDDCIFVANPAVEYDKESLSIELTAGLTDSATVTIQEINGSPLTLQTLTASNPGFSFNVTPPVLIDPWESLPLSIRFDASTLGSITDDVEIQDTIRIMTNAVNLPEFNLPVTVLIKKFVSVKENEIPATFIVREAYPNPFNPETVIPVGLPVASMVQVQVSDVLGRLVQTQSIQSMPAGWNMVRINGQGLSTGIYWVQIRAGSSVEVRRIVLLK